MAEIRIKVGSVTNAQKAKRVLLQQGIRASIQRAIQIKNGDGCGYSVVYIGQKDTGVVAALKKAGVRIISVTENDIS